MKIQDKLTLWFSLIFASILLMFATSIYLSYAKDREEEFNKRLKQKAVTKANLVLDLKVKPEVLQIIYKNTPDHLAHEEVAIFTPDLNLVYHDAADIDFIKETREMIDEIIRKKEVYFSEEKYQAVGFVETKSGVTYIVTAAAYDEYGYAKLNNLLYTIIFAFTASLVLVFIAGRFFARQALKPVSDMINQVEVITATKLDLRVNQGDGKDEIAELAVTFNRMLDRLEHSFDSQKEFVSNTSHEIRTPLAAIITELELSLTKERSIEEYKEAIRNSLNDARKLRKLSNSLLDLAKASYDTSEINFKEVRLDEILVDALEQVTKSNAAYKISMRYENEGDLNFNTFLGNEYLLKNAFTNLMENGCKFSDDNRCAVSIAFKEKEAVLKFEDKGVGIAEEDIKHLFVPFFRGKNKKFAEGNGIGLPLTKRIIQLHNGEILVKSQPQEGTAITVILPL